MRSAVRPAIADSAMASRPNARGTNRLRPRGEEIASGVEVGQRYIDPPAIQLTSVSVKKGVGSEKRRANRLNSSLSRQLSQGDSTKTTVMRDLFRDLAKDERETEVGLNPI